MHICTHIYTHIYIYIMADGFDNEYPWLDDQIDHDGDDYDDDDDEQEVDTTRPFRPGDGGLL